MTGRMVEWSAWFWIGYAGLSFGVGLMVAVAAAVRLGRSRRDHDSMLIAHRPRPPVSLILLANHDPADLEGGLEVLASLEYPAFEVIVVSDGPIGPHLAHAMARFHATPIDLIYRPFIPTARVTAVYHGSTSIDIVVVEKERAGEADALNAAMNTARSPYVCLIAANARLDRVALQRLMAPIVDDPDRVVATTGLERVFNGTDQVDHDVVVRRCPRSPAALWGVFDGLRAGLLASGFSVMTGRLWPRMGCLVLQKKAVLRVRGFAPHVGVEWTDLLLRMYRDLRRAGLPHRAVFIPLPVVWTAVPEALSTALAVSRHRFASAWSYLRNHRLQEPTPAQRIAWWPVAAISAIVLAMPAIDLVGLVWTAGLWAWGKGDASTYLVVWGVLIAGPTALACLAILLHDMTPKRYPSGGDVLKLFAVAFLDPLIVRPIRAWLACTTAWSVSSAPPPAMRATPFARSPKAVTP